VLRQASGDLSSVKKGGKEVIDVVSLVRAYEGSQSPETHPTEGEGVKKKRYRPSGIRLKYLQKRGGNPKLPSAEKIREVNSQLNLHYVERTTPLYP